MNLPKQDTVMEETTTSGSSENNEEVYPSVKVEELLRLVSNLLPSSSEVLRDALNTAENIKSEYWRPQALAAIAANLPETERRKVWKDALNATQNIQSKSLRSEVLAAIVPKLPETEPELLQQALDAAQNIQNKRLPEVLAAIAPKLPEAECRKVFQDALNAAQNIKDEWLRYQALAAIAPKLPETEPELLQQALDAAQNIKDEWLRSEALVAIASKLPETEPELLQQALNAAQNIEYEWLRSQVLAAIAPELPEAECRKVFQDALNAAQNIKDEWLRSQALAAIAPKLPETERRKVFQDALTAAQNIQSDLFRYLALAPLASELPETERRKVFQDALNAAQNIQNEPFLLQALASLALKLPEIERRKVLKDSLNDSQNIQSDLFHYLALAAIIPNLPETEPELWKNALNTSQNIESEMLRSQALVAIASKLPETERRKVFQDALNAAQNIEYEWLRSEALAAIAPKLPETELELLQQALNTAQRIKDEKYRSQPLAAIAPKLPKTDERSQKLKEAIEITEKITPDNEKVKALSNIAKKFLGFEYGLLQKILEIGLTIPNKALQAKVFNDVNANNFYHIFIAEELSKINPILFSDHISLILPLGLKLPENSGFKVLTPLLDRFSEEIVQNLPKNKLPFALKIVEQEEFEIQDEVKTRFLSALAPRLSIRLFQGSLKTIEQSIKKDRYRTDTFCNFAPYLPEEEFLEALDFIKETIQDSANKVEAFEQIIPHLSITYLVEVLEIIKQETHFSDLDKTTILLFVSDSMLKNSVWEEITKESEDNFQSLINDTLNLTTEILNNKYDKKYHKNILAIFQNLAPLLKQNKEKISETLVKIRYIKLDEKDEKQELLFELLCVLAPMSQDFRNLLEECINRLSSETYQKIVKLYIPGWLEENADSVQKILDSQDTPIDLVLHLAINSSLKKHRVNALRKLGEFSDSPKEVLNKLEFFIPYLSSDERFLAIEIARNPTNNYYDTNNYDERINKQRVEVLISIASKFPEFRQEAIEEINGLRYFASRIDLLSKLAIDIPELLLTIIKSIRDKEESNRIKYFTGANQQNTQEYLLKNYENEDVITEEDRKKILESLAVHLPNRINREVKRNNNIKTELWKRAIKLLARSYRDALQTGSLRNESAQNEDFLNLKDEINTISDLLLMRDLDPPMTVGILGGWGRGKSYIMHLMQSHITEVRSKPVTEEEAWNIDPNNEKLSPYVGHIYQIKFDAWTYAKSNLWASLMQTIFLELDRQISLEQQLAKALANKPEDSESRAEALRKEGQYWSVLYKTNQEDREYFLEKVLQKEQLEKLKENAEKSDTDGNWTKLLWEQYGEVKDTAQEKLNYQEKEREDKENQKEKKEKELEEINQKIRQQEDDQKKREAELRNKANSEVNKAIDSALGISKIILIERLGKPVFEAINKEVKTQLNQQKINSEEIGEIKNSVTTIISNVLETGKITVSENGSADKTFNLSRQALRQWISKNISLIVGFIVFSLTAIAVPIILEFFGIERIGAEIAGLIVPLVPAIGIAQKLFRSGEKWYGKAVEVLSEYGDKVEEAEKKRQKALEAKIEKEEKRFLQETTKLEKQKKELTESIETLKKETSELNLAIAETKNSLPQNPYASLNNFVKSRLAENSYEKHLGLIHQVKDDLWKLSNSLLPPTNATELGAKLDKLKEIFPRGIPRVVVYIDDLDRCPPDRVVEVLEAIQLLVKTPLFIAVLAIDERYITRALEKYYQGVLSHRGSPSGTDYLEKIIQVPYRVRPIIASNLEEYLRSQIMIQDNGTGEAKFSEFSRQEFNLLLECCKQVDLSPRTLKRLTNLYKLFKVVCRTRAHKPSYQVQKAIIALFALSGRYTNLMRSVFNEMETCFEENRTPEKASEMQTYFEEKRTPEKVGEGSQTLHLQSPLRDFFKHYKLEDNDKYLEHEFQKLKHDALYTTILPSQLTLMDITHEIFNLIRSFSFVGEVGYSGD